MDEERTQSFSHLLRHYRLTAELTQEALAERAGASARSIQALERGESRPHKDTAHLLAAGLGLNEQDRARFLAAATPAPRRRGAAAIGTGRRGRSKRAWPCVAICRTAGGSRPRSTTSAPWRMAGATMRATALYADGLALRVALGDQAGIAISYRDQALYRRSMPHAEALGDLVGVAQGLEGPAAIAARQARPAPTARLLSAAAALREQVGAPVALRDRAAHARLVIGVRAALGAAYEQAQEAGRGMPWEDLVASIFGEAEP